MVRGEAAPIVLIETLGTGTTEAMPPTAVHAALHARLEDVHGFERNEVRTDYEFTDRMEAERAGGRFLRRGHADAPDWPGRDVAPRGHRDLDRATNTRFTMTNHANVATASSVVANGIASAPERSNH